jgi:hypothetical protein
MALPVYVVGANSEAYGVRSSKRTVSSDNANCPGVPSFAF